MNVAILTMFTGLSSTYSLVNVVADQLSMLLEHDIPVKVLVSETCPDQARTGIFADPRIQWVKIVNTHQGSPITWYDYAQPTGTVHETFFQEVDLFAQDFVRHLQGVDVCILHDILYQGWHLVHNVAIRKAQEQLPHVRFLSFTHSLPVPRPKHTEFPFSARFSPMPNTTFVYPTHSGLGALAEQYGVSQAACAAVPNSMPLLESLRPEVRTIAQSVNLLRSDLLIVYPARLTTGKRFETVAALAGAIHTQTQKTVQVVFCDFPSADIPSALYKQMICTRGQQYGLAPTNIAFTSDLGFPDGFPRAGVLELFGLSNLFICPSYSESFGLTVLEAASRGNFLVLNEAVPALQELGATLGAYFMRWDARNFGFGTRETYHPSEQVYYKEHGSRIVQAMERDPSLRAKTLARTQYNPDHMFHQYLLPLLEGKKMAL